MLFPVEKPTIAFFFKISEATIVLQTCDNNFVQQYLWFQWFHDIVMSLHKKCSNMCCYCFCVWTVDSPLILLMKAPSILVQDDNEPIKNPCVYIQIRLPIGTLFTISHIRFFLKFRLSWQICLICLIFLPNWKQIVYVKLSPILVLAWAWLHRFSNLTIYPQCWLMFVLRITETFNWGIPFSLCGKS